MNENHARLCPSPEWAQHIQGHVLPSLAALCDLGDEMLEIGPGPGAATDWLRQRVKRLVCVEYDEDAAKRLAERLAGTNVEVAIGDATCLDIADGSFDSVGSFTMLHHVATTALQQRVLAEAFRVLRPGGAFLGSDSLASDGLHEFHEGDTYNPMEPAVLLVRLQAVGFTEVTLMVDDIVRWVARKADPNESTEPDCEREEGEQS
jgi:SAM-dependent methyltransferase